ncbi:MAG: CoA transferase [Sphingobium sp.]
MRETSAPFAGLFVLDLAWVVAGPAITRVLADYGADIVRVESATRVCTSRFIGPFPNGRFDIQKSACYDECNTGKRSLSLNLNLPEARAIVLELARKADVVTESFSPGQLKRWGLDYDALSADNPGLVMLSTSLMGQTGPHAGFAGYGNAGAAVGGFQTLVGHPGEQPIGPYGPYTDFVWPRFGLIALLAALDERRRTGKGCYLDVSQAEAGIQMIAPQIADYAATGRIAGPMGNRHDCFAPHGVFPCRGEDQWVAIVARDDDDWARLAHAVGGEALSPDFATLAGRKAVEARIEALLAGWTAGQTTAQVEASLQAAGVPVHRTTRTEDALHDPQLVHQAHFVRLERSDGSPSVVEASRLKLSDTPARPVRVAPFLGQDTGAVLRERLGYGEDRVAALQEARILQ